MKRFLFFLLLLSLSCSDRSSVVHDILGDDESLEKIHYVDFAKAFSKAIQNPSVFDFVKNKAKEKKDRDYNVLYSLVSDDKIDGKSFSDYIFNQDFVESFFLDKKLTSHLVTKKYPLLNIYLYNIDKLELLTSGIPIYVVLNKYKFFQKIEGDSSYTLSEDEMREVPEGGAIVIGVNERFEAEKLDNTSPLYKETADVFYANGYKFLLKDLLFSHGDTSSDVFVRSLRNNMIVLEYSRFQSLDVYKNVEGWYNGDPEMIVYFSLAYLNSNDEIKFNKHEVRIESPYVERRGFWRKRHLITNYNNDDVFSDFIIKNKDYDNTAVVLHVIEDDGDGTPLNIEVNVDLKVAKTKLSYSPLIGGRNSDLGKVTLSLQDLLSFGEINVGGFIMKYKVR